MPVLGDDLTAIGNDQAVACGPHAIAHVKHRRQTGVVRRNHRAAVDHKLVARCIAIADHHRQHICRRAVGWNGGPPDSVRVNIDLHVINFIANIDISHGVDVGRHVADEVGATIHGPTAVDVKTDVVSQQDFGRVTIAGAVGGNQRSAAEVKHRVGRHPRHVGRQQRLDGDDSAGHQRKCGGVCGTDIQLTGCQAAAAGHIQSGIIHHVGVGGLAINGVEHKCAVEPVGGLRLKVRRDEQEKAPKTPPRRQLAYGSMLWLWVFHVQDICDFNPANLKPYRYDRSSHPAKPPGKISMNLWKIIGAI